MIKICIRDKGPILDVIYAKTDKNSVKILPRRTSCQASNHFYQPASPFSLNANKIILN